MNDNQEVTEDELKAIRTMTDFDLEMLISEIHDHGWPVARKLIPLIMADAFIPEVQHQEGR